MLAIGLRFLREPPRIAQALKPTNHVATKHDDGEEGEFGQVIRRSRTFPLPCWYDPSSMNPSLQRFIKQLHLFLKRFRRKVSSRSISSNRN